MKCFVQYVFKRLVGEYFKSNIGFSNININPLRLEKLQLNCDSFNKKFLCNSPFLMSSGSVGCLTISLPSINKLIEESISVEVKDLVINFIYNEQISYDKWVSGKRGLSSENRIDDPELLKAEKIDTLEKIVRKVISNMRVKVENVVIGLSFSQNLIPAPISTPPEIVIKLQNAEAKKRGESNNRQTHDLMDCSIINDKTVEYEMVFSGLSIHMVNVSNFKDDLIVQSKEKRSGGFSYINHPSTILVCGCSNAPHLTMNYRITSITNRLVNANIDIPFVEVMLEPFQLKNLQYFSNSIQKWFRTINESELRFRSENDEEQVGRSKSYAGGLVEGAEIERSNILIASQIENSTSDLFDFSAPVNLGEAYQYDLAQRLFIPEQTDKNKNDVKNENSIIKNLLYGFYKTSKNLNIDEKKILEKDEKELFSVLRLSSEIKVKPSNDGRSDLRNSGGKAKFSGTFKGLSLILVKNNIIKKIDLAARVWLSESILSDISYINHYVGNSYFQFYLKELDLCVYDQDITNFSIREVKFREVNLVRPNPSLIYENFKEPFENLIGNKDFLQQKIVQPKLILMEIPKGWHYCLRDIIKIEAENYKPTGVDVLRLDGIIKEVPEEKPFSYFEGYASRPITERDMENERRSSGSEIRASNFYDNVELVEVDQDKLEPSFFAIDIHRRKAFSKSILDIQVSPAYVHFEPNVFEELSDLLRIFDYTESDIVKQEGLIKSKSFEDSSFYYSFYNDGEEENLRNKYMGTNRQYLDINLKCKEIRLALDCYNIGETENEKSKCFCSFLEIKSRLTKEVLLVDFIDFSLTSIVGNSYPSALIKLAKCEGYIFERGSDSEVQLEPIFLISKNEEALDPSIQISIDKKRIKNNRIKTKGPVVEKPLSSNAPLSNVKPEFSFIDIDANTRIAVKKLREQSRIESLYHKNQSSQTFRGSISLNITIPVANTYVKSKSLNLLEKFVQKLNNELLKLKVLKEQKDEVQKKIIRVLRSVYPSHFFPNEKKDSDLNRSLELGILIAEFGLYLDDNDLSLFNSPEYQGEIKKHKRNFSITRISAFEVEKKNDNLLNEFQNSSNTFHNDAQYKENQSSLKFNFFTNTKSINKSGIRVLSRFTRLCYKTISSVEKRLSVMVFDLFVSDSAQTSGEINVPRTLSIGVKMSKINSNRGEFLQKEADVQKILLYKQSALNKYELLLYKLLSNSNAEDRKSLLKILDRDAIFLGNITIIDKEPISTAELQLNFKGLVFKPDLSFPTILRLENLWKKHKDIPEDILVQEKKVQSEPSTKSIGKKRDLVFSFVFEDIYIDLFPYFEFKDLKKQSRISEISERDFASENISTKFYSTTRSIISIDRIACVLSKKPISEAPCSPPSLNILNIDLDVHQIKVLFLKYSDFESEDNHPLLLLDDIHLLSSPNSHFLKSLGFVQIMEIQNASLCLKISPTDSVQGLAQGRDQLSEKDLKSNTERFKSESKEHQAIYKTQSELTLKIGHTRFEFCRDSLHYLQMHVYNLAVRLDSFKEKFSYHSHKTVLRARGSADMEGADKSKDTSIIRTEITDINIFDDEDDEMREKVEEEKNESNDEEDEDFEKILIKKSSQEEKENKIEDTWDFMESGMKGEKKDYFSLENLEKSHLDKGNFSTKVLNLSASLESLHFRLYDGYDFNFKMKDKIKREKQTGAKKQEINEADAQKFLDLQPRVLLIENHVSIKNEFKYYQIPRLVRESLENKKRDHSKFIGFNFSQFFIKLAEYQASINSQERSWIFLVNVRDVDLEYKSASFKKLTLLSKNVDYKEGTSSGLDEERFNFLNFSIFSHQKTNLDPISAKISLYLSDLQVFFNGDAWVFMEELYNYFKQKSVGRAIKKKRTREKEHYSPASFQSHKNQFSGEYRDRKYSLNLEDNDKEDMPGTRPPGQRHFIISYFSISRISITFDFDKGELTVSQLYEKPGALINLENLRITTHDIVYENMEFTLPQMMERIKRLWIQDLKEQKKDILVKLPGVKNFYNIFKGFSSIFYEPYLNYKLNGSLVEGFKQGIFGFVGSLGGEGINFTEAIFDLMDLPLSVFGLSEKIKYAKRVKRNLKELMHPEKAIKEKRKYK